MCGETLDLSWLRQSIDTSTCFGFISCKAEN